MDSRGNGAKQTVVNSLVGKRGENSLVVLSENSENFTCEENWVKLEEKCKSSVRICCSESFAESFAFDSRRIEENS